MRVDIWSDVVCPWCYLGKRRFERALDGFEPRDEVEIVHRSFQLDPSRPPGSVLSRRAMLMSKYALTEARVRALDAQMEQTAAADGLEYHLTDAGVVGNTRDAHRLVHAARDCGLADRMLDRLYRGYFTEERLLFDTESLAELAGEAGLDASDARDVLAGHRYVDAVARDFEEARALGITGVPFFVFDGRYSVSGAQSADVLRRALTHASQA